MFGILKAGIKLGVGCTVAILLVLALLVGWLYWYFTKPAPQPRPRNRRAAILHVQGPPPLIASALCRKEQDGSGRE